MKTPNWFERRFPNVDVFVLIFGTLTGLCWIGIAVLAYLMFSTPSYARHTAIDYRIVDGSLVLSVQAPDSPAPPGPQSLAQTFAAAGQAYETTAVLQATPDSVRPALIPFELDVGSGPQWFIACVSENGFLWLEAVTRANQSCPASLAFTAEIAWRLVVFADYSDLQYARVDAGSLDGTTDVAIGAADPLPPWRWDQSGTAWTVVWYEQPYRAGGETTQQVLFVDRGAGDFDLIFNWGESAWTNGWHGFSLGSSAWFARHGAADLPDHFCFRHGRARVC